MAGTHAGGIKTRDTNRKLHGEDHYRKIGAIGGRTAHKVNPETGKALKGFAINGKASEAGRIGGKVSRRGKGSATV